jgi:hypothetical protein
VRSPRSRTPFRYEGSHGWDSGDRIINCGGATLHCSLRAIALLAGLAHTAVAQGLGPATIGRQVRIVTIDGNVVTGELVGLRTDTALIAMATVVPLGAVASSSTERVGLRIALASIQSHAVFIRYKRRTTYGALVGGGLGLVLVNAARVADDRAPGRSVGRLPVELRSLAWPAAVVLTGTGALIGSAIGPKRWVGPNGAHVTASPLPSGARVGIALSF